MQAPAQVQFDGVNLLPYLLEAKSGTPHERLHWRGGGGYALGPWHRGAGSF